MNKQWGLIVPFALLNSVVLVTALFKTIRISLGYFPLLGLHNGTFEYYQAVFKNHLLVDSLLNSLGFASLSTISALVLGLVVALFLARFDQRFLNGIYQLPITLPHLIVALMVIQFVSQSGIISRICYQLGWIDAASAFPLLVHDKAGLGMFLVYMYKEIPYVAVASVAILKQLNQGYIEVAKNLGASKTQTFFRITLPLLQPTLATLFIVLFCFTFSAFEVPYLLGNPAKEMIGVTSYQLFTQVDLQTRPQAFALNLVMSSISLSVTVITLLISRLLPGGRKVGAREKK